MIKKVVILKPKKSLNFSESINAGVKNSYNSKIFVANDDIIISKQTMERLAEKCDENTITGPDSNCNIGWITDMVYSAGGINLVPSMNLDQVSGVVDEIYKIVPTRNDTRQLEWLAFFATMIHRKAFDDVGLLDETFVYDREDLSWCMEASKHGKKFLYCYDSYCFHFGGVSRKKKHQELGLKHEEDTLLNQYYYNAKHGIRKTKPIDGFEEYLISEDGIVISNKDWEGVSQRLMKLSNRDDGHVVIRFNDTSYDKLVHWLVADSFIPNPNSLLEVNHKNGIKSDNRVENLEWVDTKKKQKGDHKESNITEDQAVYIKKMYKYSNISQIVLADRFGISQTIVNEIVEGDDWIDVNSKPVIGIYCHNAWEAWDEKSLNTPIQEGKPAGIGGSETQVILLSRELSKLGYRVKVFNRCQENHFDSEGYDVEYIFFTSFGEYSKTIFYDHFVASRYLDCFDHSFDSANTVVMIHDVFIIMGGRDKHDVKLDKVDKYLALSHRHKKFVSEYHGIPEDKILVTSNGLDLTRFDRLDHIQRDPYKLIYSSSPDRGLELLLELFPKLNSKAHLHIYYGFENFRDQNYVNKIMSKITELNISLGNRIFYHGRVGQDKLAEEFKSSAIWAYPTWFAETYCITALEAMAGGSVAVTSDFWGISDTVKEAGILLPMYDNENTVFTSEYQNRWISECNKLLEDHSYQEYWREKGYSRAKLFTWSQVSIQWHQYFSQGTFNEIQCWT